jgi:hypothetical protein
MKMWDCGLTGVRDDVAEDLYDGMPFDILGECRETELQGYG